MTLGITVGTLYPFHHRHHYLIRQAKAQVDGLVVLLDHKPSQTVPGPVRAAWVRFLHPDVEVIEVFDTKKKPYVIVEGSRERRLSEAIRRIDEVLVFPRLDDG